jgi:hypothetical protein
MNLISRGVSYSGTLIRFTSTQSFQVTVSSIRQLGQPCERGVNISAIPVTAIVFQRVRTFQQEFGASEDAIRFGPMTFLVSSPKRKRSTGHYWIRKALPKIPSPTRRSSLELRLASNF